MAAATSEANAQKTGNGSKKDAEVKLDTDAERKRLDAQNKGGEPREGRKMDDPMRVLARRAVEIAESGGADLGSAVTAPQAQLIKDRLGGDPMGKFKPATQAQMLGYAQGGRGSGRSELPDEALSKLRDFCRQTGSRRIWPRKVAAVALALHEEKSGKTIPHTKKEAVPEKAAASA